MRRLTRTAAISGVGVTAVLFFVYLGYVYSHLEDQFERKSEFVPTRLYSDANKIAQAQNRDSIETLLKNLRYSYEPDQDDLLFELHPITYPLSLIPENHPTFQHQGHWVRLGFDGKSGDSSLRNILAGPTKSEMAEVSELYLEPELISTFGNSDEQLSIRKLRKFEEFPPELSQAIISVEDQNFMTHWGLDPKGILRAIWVDLKTLSLAQGGSTITLQLVKNLRDRRGKNIFLKINELFLAILLELKFSKEQILERYLNEVYLGQIGNFEVRGAEEGARLFFNKNLSQLNLAEITLMVGLIRGPAYYSPYRHWDRALARQQLVLQKMLELGKLSPEKYQEALTQKIILAPPPSELNKAPYFTDFAKSELLTILDGKISEEELPSAGLKIYTTLDLLLNRKAQSILEQRVPDPLQGALVMADHTNGQIKSLIGGKSFSKSSFNRTLNMKRQAGSTFKPLVYLAALQKEVDLKGIPYGPAYPMHDAPIEIKYDQNRKSWKPKNYEPGHSGWVTFRQSLADSINTTTAFLGMEVGLEFIMNTAREMGITSEMQPVPALSLGAFEVSIMELLNVYATIANHGARDQFSTIQVILDAESKPFARVIHTPKQIINRGTADLMIDLLTSVVTDGTGKTSLDLGWDQPAGGKTGTTSNYRDAWFAGFTSQLTTVVWVGPDVDQENVKLPKITGAMSALPIWVDIMNSTLTRFLPAPFPVSEFLTEVTIDRHSGQKATSDCPIEQTMVEKYLTHRLPENTTCKPTYGFD